MAEKNYMELKERIEELIKSIDTIDAEATSFADSKKELKDAAENLKGISSDLSVAIKTSEKVLEQVNTLAIDGTLDSFKRSADDFAKTSEVQNEKIMSRIDETEKYIEVIKATSEETLNEFKDDVKKKVIILGGASVVCALISLICALII